MPEKSNRSAVDCVGHGPFEAKSCDCLAPLCIAWHVTTRGGTAVLCVTQTETVASEIAFALTETFGEVQP